MDYLEILLLISQKYINEEVYNMLLSGVSSISDLLSYLRIYRYLIVEGFDSVGKTTFIDKLKDRNLLGDTRTFIQPDYKNFLGGIVEPSNRYLIGTTLNYLISKKLVNLDNTPIVIDRGIVSSLVYNELYNQKVSALLQIAHDLSYVDMYGKLEGVGVIYLYHEEYSKARQLYEAHEVRESYDLFVDFDEYWSVYSKAHGLYLKYLNNLPGLGLSSSRVSELFNF